MISIQHHDWAKALRLIDKLPNDTGDADMSRAIVFSDKDFAGYDVDKAMHYYRASAAAGNCYAGATVAFLYANYDQLKFRNIEAANAYAKKSITCLADKAGKNDSKAQFDLGEFYMMGLGVPKNDRMALRFFEEAGHLGDVDAIDVLVYIYANGIGVTQSFGQAILYQKHLVTLNVSGSKERLQMLERYYDRVEKSKGIQSGGH